MKTLSRLILRHAGLVALFGTLMSVGGAYYSIKLFGNLKTDIEELLPSAARSVVDMNEVTQRLEAIDNITLLIRSSNTQASRKFVDDLAKELNKIPKDTAARIEYKIKDEIEFFKKRKSLFVDVRDLEKIRDYVRDRIEFEKSLYNPFTIFNVSTIEEPKFDFRGLMQRYTGKVGAYDRFPEGYYATPDETKRAVLVYLPGKSSGITNALKLRSAVEKVVAEVNPAKYAPDIDVKYTGNVQNLIEEHEALIEDLMLSTVVVVVLVTVAMLIYFRSFTATSTLIFSLFAGTFWTFGLSFFAVGYLNANSAFLGSIVIGNGVNFGIIFLARYLEDRRRNYQNLRALTSAMRTTTHSTLIAALAAGSSYGSLMLTSFRGFNQFGVIGLIGMIFCWLSSVTLLPAYLLLFEKWKILRPSSIKLVKSSVAGRIAAAISKAPLLFTLAFAGLTVFTVLPFAKLDWGILETDLSKLRNKKSFESGSAFWSKYVDEIFLADLSPVAVLANTREEAIKIRDALKIEQDKPENKDLIATVQTMQDFVPTNQEAKVEVLREIRALLTPRILRELSDREKQLVNTFLTPESFRPFAEKDLPELILSKFREKDGSIGKMVLTGRPITAGEVLNSDNLFKFVKLVRHTADSVRPGIPVAGQLPITNDMLVAIKEDGPKATLFAFLAVVFIVIILFRNLKAITLILASLILGMIWMGGIVLYYDIKINFLNFIALPITFGIGVDYGVNVFQRYRLEKQGGILNVVRNTGGAVILASLTTIIGYGSLLIASNQAFVSFGLLSVLGEITCVVAAVFALPAALHLMRTRKI